MPVLAGLNTGARQTGFESVRENYNSLLFSLKYKCVDMGFPWLTGGGKPSKQELWVRHASKATVLLKRQRSR